MKKWLWALAGIVVTSAILFAGYNSHRHFRDAITTSFNDQQGLFARAMVFAIQDHLLEEEQDLRSTIDILNSRGLPFEDPRRVLTSLYETHRNDFESVSLHNTRGRIVTWVPADHSPEPPLASFLEKTIARNDGFVAAFLSDPYPSPGGSAVVYLCIPFSPADGETFVAVAGIRLGAYLSLHFPSWQGKRMGFVLTDNSGELLAVLNTTHDLDQKMMPGNIFSLGRECLECHGERDFSDVWEAFRQERVVHSRYRSPGGSVEKNRSTQPFRIFNKKWSMTVLSPFESIQRAIERNLSTSLPLTALALFLVAGVSYFFLKAASYEKLAAAAKALQRSEEALRSYSGRLEEANRLKDLFTDIVRHDLMSAVSAVKGYAAILREGEPDRERRKVFGAMEGSLAKLRDLIEGASTISRLEEGLLETSPSDVTESLRHAIERTAGAAEEKKIVFDVKMPDVYVLATSALLEEVFVNLLSNAVKYSPVGSRVEVRLEETATGLLYAVKDWGEGIPDEYKNLIFERLERLEKAGIKGSGLGLAIVRRIIVLHNGRIDVTDNPEGGSVFTVRIPPG